MRFRRKNIRLPAPNYLGRRRFFLTLCCEQRRATLANDPLSQRSLDILRDTPSPHAFAVYDYCLLPDHMHVLVEGLRPSSSPFTFFAHL